MVDLGDQGENIPADGAALGAHGAPIANPPAPQIPHQESGGARSSTSLTMTEFTAVMELFKSSMEMSMKALVRDEVDKKLASFSQSPSTSSTFRPNATLDVDGVKETPTHHHTPLHRLIMLLLLRMLVLIFLCRILIMQGTHP